jgi:galactose mutarotase-like enzyme
VENLGFSSQPLMMLYHMNFGWPLVNENSFLTPSDQKVTPQGDVAAKGMDKWDKMQLPSAGFAEEVFYHDIAADENGFAAISLTNPDEKVKLTVGCRKAELPYIVQWKQMGLGEYVLGIEPGNCVPENQNGNRQKGILRTIAPGETVKHKVTVTLEKID